LRIRVPILSRAQDDVQASLQSLLASIKPREFLRRVKVRVGERVLIIDVGEIACFRAESKYTTLYTGDREYVIEDSLSSLESRLDPHQFIRIHRSAIVNVAFIQEIIKHPGENPIVRMKCVRPLELPVSRGYASSLERI
jgi:two-component system LytT family response regulator